MQSCQFSALIFEETLTSKTNGGPLKRHIVAKKKTEYKDYGEQIADLATQYTQPYPNRVQQALHQGDI